jgi:hypothetical protein
MKAAEKKITNRIKDVFLELVGPTITLVTDE